MSPRLPILVGTLVAVVMISLPVAAQQERTAWGDRPLAQRTTLMRSAQTSRSAEQTSSMSGSARRG